MVVDSGFRCHLTDYTRATAAAPSAFVAQLRKFLKTRRVTSVVQIGTDRIIEFQFSDGQYRLFLEFYAGGNIILTDKDLSIIALLRIVDEEQEKLKVGLKYSLDYRQNYNGIPGLTAERVRAGLERTLDKEEASVTGSQKRLKKKPEQALRRALAASLNEFPPLLLEHALQLSKFDTRTPVEEILKDGPMFERLLLALQEAKNIVDGITSTQICKGYIIAKPSNNASAVSQSEAKEDGNSAVENLMYEDFHPFRLRQSEENPEISILEFDGFNKTVDEFFSSIESQKLEMRLTEREEHAKRKLENARLDHEKRLGGLQQVQELNVRKAQAIEANLQRVQEAIAAVNGLLAQGMDWMDVARLVEMEQAKHNVVAEMIKLPLKLYENTATLLLSEATFEDEDEYDGDETDSDVSDSGNEVNTAIGKSTKAPNPTDVRLAIDVDLALSPWSNACRYYGQKKSAAVKEQKTLQSSEKALKSTERKIGVDLRKGLKQEKEVMRPQRKALWFEKFIYFISSEGYLVLGGRDLPQTEILYSKYLRKGDVYVHADLQGAASIIVKNKSGMMNSPIPPSTLSQAGILAVATSSAWDSKAVMSAWWVNADQVSKIAPTGEYLATGSFTIRDHKNFLPPAQLVLGFGVIFRISDESKVRHLKHRFQDDSSIASGNGAEVVEGRIEANNEEHDSVNQTESETEDPQTQDNDNDQIDGDEDGHKAVTKISGVGEVDGDSDDDTKDNSASEVAQDNASQPTESQYGTPNWQDQTANGMVAASESSNEDVEPEKDEDVAVNGETPASDDRKRHLSAKERRLLRQGSSVPSNGPPRAVAGRPSEEYTRSTTPATAEQPSAPGQPITKSQAPSVRGKHGKQNKLKTKYANQDEEDRALAMRLLGSAAAQQKATEDAAAKATKDQELAEQKERRRKQHALATEKGKEAEKIRRLRFEEGAETSDDGEAEELGDLDAFIGTPLPGDDLLDALVICGPWDAIGSRCRWRVKLQPGTTKKGKAVREILHTWVNVITDREKKRRPGAGEGNEVMMEEERVRRREGELIRAIRETEVIGVVPVGKVRVAIGAGAASGKGRGGGAGKGKRGGKGSKKQK